MERNENKKRFRLKSKVITIILCIICLVIGFVVGCVIPGSSSSSTSNSQLLSEIMEIIDENWVNSSSEDSDDNDTTMIKGFVSSLGDPYTSYMTLDESQDFASSINGSYVGVGVSFSTCYLGAIVVKAYGDAPAYQAGIRAGDVITAADGTSLSGKTSTQIQELVAGKENTEVKLTVLRDNKEMDVTVTRASFESDVEYYVKDNYGYLQLNTFGDDTANHVEEALKYFKENNAGNIIIDIRGNSGGYLQAVWDILSLFVPTDQILFTIKEKSQTDTYKSKDGNKYTFDKGYILMNGDSASCSEVLIGALTELMDYKTIGQTSYGKGIAQTQVTLSNGSILKYTYGKWFTPSGVNIHGKGFTPDYEVKDDDISNYAFDEFEDTYSVDSVDDNVALMQKMLKGLGYEVDRTDGYFSKTTEEMLKQYQKHIGVSQDGKYTYSIANRLLASLAYQIYQNSTDQGLTKAIELCK